MVAAARAGDRVAFTRLFRLHVDRVRGQLTRFIGPSLERDDLIQQLFLLLHRALPGYRGESSLATFLHRITVNAAIDHLRSGKRQVTRSLGDAELDELVGHAHADGPFAGALRERLGRCPATR